MKQRDTVTGPWGVGRRHSRGTIEEKLQSVAAALSPLLEELDDLLTHLVRSPQKAARRTRKLTAVIAQPPFALMLLHWC